MDRRTYVRLTRLFWTEKKKKKKKKKKTPSNIGTQEEDSGTRAHAKTLPDSVSEAVALWLFDVRMILWHQVTVFPHVLWRGICMCCVEVLFYQAICDYITGGRGSWSLCWPSTSLSTFELQHDKTNKVACAPSEDSNQTGHQPSLISLRCALSG